MKVLLWKELLEQWRSYRMLAVVAVLGVMGILGPLTARYMNELMASIPGTPEGLEAVLPEPTADLAVAELVDNLAQFGLILALLIPMASVVGEKHSGTAALTLSKPVSRAAFLLAKLLALAGDLCRWHWPWRGGRVRLHRHAVHLAPAGRFPRPGLWTAALPAVLRLALAPG